jgi:hypothetical protein
MLQSIIDDLAGDEQNAAHQAEKSESADLLQEAIAENAKRTEAVGHEQAGDNEQVSALITKIQTAFNPRIERILASGGGLLVVVNQSTQTDEVIAQELSQTELPVVVIEAKTLSSLQRLGASSPVADAKVVFEEQNQQSSVNPLVKVAKEKLRSAEMLVEQQCYAGVMDILAITLLTVATYASKQEQVPSIEKATVWLYSDILPKQMMTAEQVAGIVRVLSLSQNIDVPDALIEQALADTQALVVQYGE